MPSPRIFKAEPLNTKSPLSSEFIAAVITELVAVPSIVLLVPFALIVAPVTSPSRYALSILTTALSLVAVIKSPSAPVNLTSFKFRVVALSSSKPVLLLKSIIPCAEPPSG